MYVGISSTHLADQDLVAGGQGNVRYQLARHYYIVGGYTFKTNILTLSRINRAQNYIVEYLDSKTILFRFEKERTGSYNFISSIEGRWIKK